ncbi:MAG: DUF4214 domain-containing protein [Clostridia bacterium]|nr:DUF4214 domain-containing protein [Clostridia bacterium]
MKRTILGLLALALLASLLVLLPMAAQATIPDTETCPSDPSGGTHDYVVTFEEANCQHGLIERGTCSKCGKTYEFDYGQKGDHAFGDYEYFYPTCTEYGGTRRVCSVCGYVEELLEIEPLGHEEVGVPAKAATCTETGLTEGSKCSRCGTVLTPQETIPALGHDPVIVQGYGATCTAAGLSEGSKCSRCGTILTAQTEIPPLGHEFLKYSDKDATCTQAGERTWYCSRCTETKIETLPALGHAWGGWAQVSAATCTAEGSQTRTCSRCGAQETQAIAALGHAAQTVAGYAATCTAAGLTDGSKCSRCGEMLTAQTAIPALGHAAQTVSGYAATCTAAGLTEGSKCSVCGAILTEQAYTPALGHDYEATEYKEATATEDGYIKYVCSRCWDSYTEIITKLPHEHAYVVTAETPAACTSEGVRTYACTICGNSYSESTPALGHVPQALPGKAPTCTEPGLTEGSVCSRCGVVLAAQTAIPAIGHNWGAWYTVKEATATQDGWMQRTCQNDPSHVEYQVIPATGEENVTPDPGQSQLKVTAEEAIWRPSDSRDPEGYLLGDFWGVVTNVENVGPVDIYDFTLHVDYVAANEWSHSYSADASDGSSWYEMSNQIRPSNDIAAGTKINFSCAAGDITQEDVARGYIYILVSVRWVDPESGIERVDYAEPLIYPVISKTGLVLKKDIDHAPENGEYFREGEEIPWTLTVTNNSEESITNVTVTDEDVVVGTFAEIAAGETVSCTVPPHTVTEYETIVGTVTNIATAVGTDLKGVDHTYMSNSVSVPTNDHSPTPLPPIGDPDTGGGGITEEPVPPVIPETLTTPDTPEGHFDPSMLPTGIPALEPVLGPDGMPILGPDGTPFLAPPGTTVVLDGDGNVLLSPFGTAVMMLPDGTYFTIGPDGRPILTDKDGNPILDANGNYIYIDFDTLYSCALNLEALGSAEAQYTLHACMDHKAAAEAAEAALNAGNGAEACRIWKEAIEELYGILYEAGDDGAKAALTEEKAAFEAFADSYAALAGSKAAAEVWRLKCARLCSIVHTLPENLPESLAGEYATILGGGRSYDETARVIGALYGYDSSMAEEYSPAEAETLKNVKEMLNIVSSWNYDSAFERGQQLWTMTLDRRVNAVYKAADPETRTKIAAWRVALDALAAAETTLSGMLYPDDAAIPAEIVMNLFKDSVFDSVKLLNGEDEPADEGAKVKEFVARCYRYALGREGSEGEIASWAAMVTDGGRRVEDIARDILGSAEFRSRNLNNEEIVKALYLIYFNREADAGGLATWVGVLDRGEGIETVEAGLTGSDEFKSVMGE